MAKISPGTMTAAIFAILLGLAGSYTVRQYLDNKPTAEQVVQERRARQVIVPIAARDIQPGETLSINDIVIRSFSPEEFPNTEYAKQSFMPNTKQIMERMVKEEIQAGAVFLPTQFYPDNQGPTIADLLKPGYRAVTVPIENIGAVQGFARPGSVVDVLFRAQLGDDRPEVTITLLEGVNVLALGHNIVPGQVVDMNDRQASTGSVTLAVLPTQAQSLKVAEGRGEMSLALRHPDEAMQLQPVSKMSQSMTLEELVGMPIVQNRKVEIYRAAQKQVVEFGSDADSYNDPLNQLINVPVVNDRPAPAVTSPPANSVSQVSGNSAQ